MISWPGRPNWRISSKKATEREGKSRREISKGFKGTVEDIIDEKKIRCEIV